jgi:hypothetical protein
LRDAYNASYQQVKQAITAGTLLSAGATNLASAVGKLLDPKVEAAAVTSAQQALDGHDAAFASKANSGDITEAELKAYYDQRKTLEAALEAAKAKLEATKAKRAAAFGSNRKALEEAAQVLADLKAATIGNALTWDWTPPG